MGKDYTKRNGINSIGIKNIVLSCLFVFMVIAAISVCKSADTVKKIERISSESGIIDLSSINIYEDNIFSLEGEWEFVYGEHIPVEKIDKKAALEGAEFIKVPSTWKNYVYKGQKLPGTGIATYRLRIITGENIPKYLAFRIPGWETAYTMYVNGIEIASAGASGNSSENTISKWKPQIGYFFTDGNVQDVVIHISNFEHARGGVSVDLSIGRIIAVSKARELGIGLRLFSFGSLFMISIYHAAIFVMRRNERSALYFSVVCMLMALRSLVIHEHPILLYFPWLSWNQHVRITYFPFGMMLSGFVLFINSMYKEDMNKALTNIFVFLGACYSVICLVLPPIIFTNLIAYFQAIIILGSAYLIAVMLKAFRKKREGAGAFLCVFAIGFIFVLNDTLHHNYIISTGYVVPIGFILFIFLQAIILADRYSKTFVKIEELSNEKMILEGEALELQNLSYIDGLTGIANRRKLDEYLDVEWQRAIRSGEEISFIMIDIDFFKKYNDKYGHLAGDEVLCIVAKEIKKSARRATDLAARYGGEEFAMILPNTGIDSAFKIAEGIRKSILKLNLPTADKTAYRSLSISLGCSAIRPEKDVHFTELITRADRALYLAKTNGRNRTELQ